MAWNLQERPGSPQMPATSWVGGSLLSIPFLCPLQTPFLPGLHRFPLSRTALQNPIPPSLGTGKLSPGQHRTKSPSVEPFFFCYNTIILSHLLSSSLWKLLWLLCITWLFLLENRCALPGLLGTFHHSPKGKRENLKNTRTLLRQVQDNPFSSVAWGSPEGRRGQGNWGQSQGTGRQAAQACFLGKVGFRVVVVGAPEFQSMYVCVCWGWLAGGVV